MRSIRSIRSRHVLVLVVLLAIAGCAWSAPAGSQPHTGPATVGATPDGGTAGSGSPEAAGSGPPGASDSGAPSATTTPTATATPAPVAGPLSGSWRVRKVLAQGHRSTLASAAFAEEAWRVRPGCEAEPCPTLEVSITPLARSRPVTTATLERDGDAYGSAATPGSEVPCLNLAGDRVPGGAATTRMVRLWLAETQPDGSAVRTVALHGVIELRLSPTPIGIAAGCSETTARYDLTGHRGAVAVIDQRPRAPVVDPGDLVDLPAIEVEVSGAAVEYFEVEGSTTVELLESVALGGVRACGEIDYEWHEGDARPAACAVSRFPGFEDGIREGRDAAGECVIVDADIDGRYTIHFPRWVAPARVPAALLAWWRDVVEWVRVHEAVHVEISRDAVAALETELDGADCDDAGSIVRAWARDLQAAQAAFDRAEYAKPWPQPPRGV